MFLVVNMRLVVNGGGNGLGDQCVTMPRGQLQDAPKGATAAWTKAHNRVARGGDPWLRWRRRPQPVSPSLSSMARVPWHQPLCWRRPRHDESC